MPAQERRTRARRRSRRRKRSPNDRVLPGRGIALATTPLLVRSRRRDLLPGRPWRVPKGPARPRSSHIVPPKPSKPCTPLSAAESLAEGAVVLRHTGEARDAVAAQHRAKRPLARCEGAATPPARMISARARPTPGELDNALRASASHSNKQIASEAHLSVRTVESNLQRVYEKLGISGRDELADALRDIRTDRPSDSGPGSCTPCGVDLMTH